MPVAVEVGNFRHCIQIQDAQALSDSRLPDGGFADDYDDLKTIWAEKIPLRGRAVFPDDRVDDEVMFRFRSWLDEDITSESRALYRDKVYNIKSVLPDNDDKFMVMEFVLPENEPTGDND